MPYLYSAKAIYGTVYTAVAFMYGKLLQYYQTVRLLLYMPFGAGAAKRKRLHRIKADG